MKKYFRIGVLIPTLMLTLLVCSQDNVKIQISEVINDFKNDEALKHASWGLCVYDISAGKILAEYDKERSLIPASTLKLFTTITAMEVLGVEFKFETTLQYTGEITENGVLKGNLFIKGGGDPTFGSDRFGKDTQINSIYSKWLESIKNLGIKRIEGKIIGDASIFDDMMAPPSWVWGDIGNYYGSGASGLTIHENLYEVFFKPGVKIDDTAYVLRTEPEIPEMEFVNNVLTYTKGSGDRVYIYGAPYRNKRILRGTVPMGKPEFGVKGSIPDPAFFCAASFTNFLKENSIQISEEPRTLRELILKNKHTDTERKNIATHFSPALKEIVKLTNMKSINTYAECMFRMLGVTKKQEGSLTLSSEALEEFWKEKGLGISGLDINDGSGLSRSNCLTAEQLAEMLAIASKFNSINQLTESLPIAGKSGSISSLCKTHFAEGNLMAKSGYMSGVRSYAGFVKSRSGNLRSFAIIINNYETSSSKMKKKLEQMLMAIADIE